MDYQDWAEVRHQYGDTYLTVFNDGFSVPWKPLSIGEYIHYDHQIARMVVPSACLEDEVFCKCVQDQDILESMDKLSAGIVTTVVHNIWEYSGPNTPQDLQKDFESARSTLKEGRAAVIHQCAYMIATGFNYTLEQVYAMEYDTFLLRLAQAEAKMLTMKIITDPLQLNFSTSPEEKFANLNPERPPTPERVKVDAKEAWDRQQASQVQQRSQPTPDKPKGKWWGTSPVLEAEKRRNINFTAEKQAADDTVLDSHERNEKGAMKQYIIDQKLSGQRDKMLDDAKIIYKDLIESLDKSRK